MRITLAEGMHYCYDCGELILDDEHSSVWYCDYHAKKRGWNIIDGRRIKIKKDENENNGTISAGDTPPEEGNINSKGND